jgi:hypothetical protein
MSHRGETELSFVVIESAIIPALLARGGRQDGEGEVE